MTTKLFDSIPTRETADGYIVTMTPEGLVMREKGRRKASEVGPMSWASLYQRGKMLETGLRSTMDPDKVRKVKRGLLSTGALR